MFYADDIVLVSPAIPGLRKLIAECELFAHERDINFNPSKSKAISFYSNSIVKLEPPTLTLCGLKLDFVDSFRYLGVNLCSNLSDSEDIIMKLRSLYATGNSLIRNFGQCSIDVKRQLFISYCSQFFCSALWSNFCLWHHNRLRVGCNNIVRKYFKLPWRKVFIW